jgi:hypothetical protein
LREEKKIRKLFIFLFQSVYRVIELHGWRLPEC